MKQAKWTFNVYYSISKFLPSRAKSQIFDDINLKTMIYYWVAKCFNTTAYINSVYNPHPKKITPVLRKSHDWFQVDFLPE